MDVYRLALTVLVTAGVVVAILLFEKRRARQIERDTRDLARGRELRDEAPRDEHEGGPDDGPGDGPGGRSPDH